MHTTFKEMLLDLRGEGLVIAAKVAKVADAHAVTCEHAGSSAKLLAEVGLEPDDVGPLDVHQAETVSKAYSNALDGEYGRKPQKAEDVALQAQPGADTGPKKRQLLFGFPVTAVIRWMGHNRWNMEQCRAALKGLRIELAEGTVYAQLRAGVTGDRGDPAELQSDHVAQLIAATKKAD